MRLRHGLIVVALVVAAAYAWQRLRRASPTSAARSERSIGASVGGGIAGDGEPDGGIAAEAPPPLPGTLVELTLLEAPAVRYAAATVSPADEAWVAITAELGGGAVAYDADLARAAREVAYFAAVQHGPPPEPALEILLHASGAAELGAAEYFTSTTSESPDVVRDTIGRALAATPPGDGLIRLGVGEVSTPGETYSRHVCVLVTRRGYTVEPAARRVGVGERWRLRGRLPPRTTGAEASALHADGRIEELAVAMDPDGRGFALAVEATTPGPLAVDLDGDGPAGPGKIVQLTVEVGPELPRRFTVRVPDKDPPFADLAAAEAYAFALLGADRARAGVAALAHDPALAALARAHSADMRDHHFFAHLSPRTGLADDRLTAARYRTIAHGENLARNDTLVEAEMSLLASVGHRRSLLDPRFTRVGIGLARDGDDGDWYLTQLFVRPVRDVDPDAVIAVVHDRIAAARAVAGAPPLVEDASLSALAQDRARRAAEGELAGLAEEISHAAAKLVDRQVAVSVHGIYEPETFVAPPVALDVDMQQIGIGAWQSERDPGGRIGVVIILGR